MVKPVKFTRDSGCPARDHDEFLVINVVHILAVIPATSCSAARLFSALRRLRTYLRNTWGKNVSVMFIALINIERAYANSVVNNDMDRIIDIFGRRNGRDGYFF